MSWQPLFKLPDNKNNPQIQQIIFSDISVNISYKKIKNLHLRICGQNGDVKISAPQRMNFESIRVFVISKLNWIKKQQARLQLQVREKPKEYLSLENHCLFGKSYCLNLSNCSGKAKVILQDNTIELFVKEKATKEQKEKILHAWYREQLKKIIADYIDKWQSIINVQAQAFSIKKMKTRWGTCNIRTKKIWLNLELAKKSLPCIEYVVVHELVHLLEPSHNKRFVAYMNQFLPNWRVCQEELTKNILHRDRS